MCPHNHIFENQNTCPLSTSGRYQHGGGGIRNAKVGYPLGIRLGVAGSLGINLRGEYVIVPLSEVSCDVILLVRSKKNKREIKTISGVGKYPG